MISFNDISRLFSVDLEGKFCIEIEFFVKDIPKYQSCWMGKSSDETNKEEYWFGLVPDGTEAYSFKTFKEFVSAPVFDGKSLKEIWDNVELWSLDGCDPEERIHAYIE